MYGVVSMSALELSDLIIQMYPFFLSYCLRHSLSQETGYSSLCSTVDLMAYPF